MFDREITKKTALPCTEEDITSHAKELLYKLNKIMDALQANIAQVTKIISKEAPIDSKTVLKSFNDAY